MLVAFSTCENPIDYLRSKAGAVFWVNKNPPAYLRGGCILAYTLEHRSVLPHRLGCTDKGAADNLSGASHRSVLPHRLGCTVLIALCSLFLFLALSQVFDWLTVARRSCYPRLQLYCWRSAISKPTCFSILASRLLICSSKPTSSPGSPATPVTSRPYSITALDSHSPRLRSVALLLMTSIASSEITNCTLTDIISPQRIVLCKASAYHSLP